MRDPGRRRRIITDVQFVGEAEEKRAYVQGRNAFFCSVVDWYKAGRLPQEHLNRLLSDAWNAAEWPAQLAKASDLNDRQIVEMFREAGFVTDTSSTERPTQPLRIYRGCTEFGTEGFSWSTEPEVARKFAKREGWFGRDEDEYGAPVIVTTVIDPEYVLAVFPSDDSRREREVVVDPIGLDTVAMLYFYDFDVPDIEAVAELLSAERTALSALSQAEREDWMRRVVFDIQTVDGPIHVLLVGNVIIAYPHERGVRVYQVDDYEPTGHEAPLHDDWRIEFEDCSDGFGFRVRRIEHPTDMVIGFSEMTPPGSPDDWKGWGYAWNMDHPQASSWQDFGTVTFVSEGHRLTRDARAALTIAILTNRSQATDPKPIVQGGELSDDAREGLSGHIQWLVDYSSAVIEPSVREWERPESVSQSCQDETE